MVNKNVDVHAKAQHTISSASRGTSSGNNSIGGASGGGKPPVVQKQWKVNTGEPTGPIIHALDIRILYTDPSKVDEDPYKSTLPTLTRDWFKNNKNKQVPAKFKNYSGSNSTAKSKKKNRNKKTKFKRMVASTETNDDGSSANEVDDDDDELSSAT